PTLGEDGGRRQQPAPTEGQARRSRLGHSNGGSCLTLAQKGTTFYVVFCIRTEHSNVFLLKKDDSQGDPRGGGVRGGGLGWLLLPGRWRLPASPRPGRKAAGGRLGAPQLRWPCWWPLCLRECVRCQGGGEEPAVVDSLHVHQPVRRCH